MKAIKECKVYTPKNVADFMIDSLDLNFNSYFNILEPAVGTGFIFLVLIERFLIFFKDKDDEFIKNKLENNFCAYDVEFESLEQLKTSLNNLLEKYNRNIIINWNLKEIDILDLHDSKSLYGKFTHVICNPPYISYKNITDEQKEKIEINKYKTISKSNYDLYLIFIEEISKYLVETGKAVLIVPFNYLRADYSKKSLNYLIEKNKIKTIYEFLNNTLFKEIAPLSCIFEMEYNESDILSYKMDDDMKVVSKSVFENTLEENENDDCVNITEYCHVYGGVAPLNNHAFMIRGDELESSNKNKIYFNKNNVKYSLPQKYIRKVYAINEKKKTEKIDLIFPYIFNNENNLQCINLKQNPSLNKYLEEIIEDEYKFYGKTQNLRFYHDKKLCFSAIASSFAHTFIEEGYIYGGICAVVKDEYKIYENEIFDRILEKIPQLKEKVKKESLVYNGGYYNFKSKHLKSIMIKKIGEDKCEK